MLSLSIIIDEKEVEKSTNDVETVSSTSAEASSSKKATTASAATEITDKSTTFEPFQSNDNLRMVRFEDHLDGRVIGFMGGDTILKFIAEKYDESSKLYPKHIAERCLIDEKLWFASNKLLKRMEDYFVSEVNVKLKKKVVSLTLFFYSIIAHVTLRRFPFLFGMPSTGRFLKVKMTVTKIESYQV